MAQLKDSLITGDLRVTGTIYGVGSQLTQLNINNVTSGTLPVEYGGTGQTSIENIQAGKDGNGNLITTNYAASLTKENDNSTIKLNNKSNNTLSSISIDDATTQIHGLMSIADKSKLDGIHLVNINGSSQNGGNIYAPTAAGNSGQMIVSTGTGAPEWKTVSYTTINTGYTITNGTKMTASVNNGVLLFTSSSVGITSSGTTSVVNGFNGVVSSSVPNGNEVSY